MGEIKSGPFTSLLCFCHYTQGSLSIDSITHLLYWQQQHTCSDHWSHVRVECHISCSLKTFIWTHTLYEWQKKKALALKSQLLQKDPSTRKRHGSLACSPSFSQQTPHTELLSDTQEISPALQLQPTYRCCRHHCVGFLCLAPSKPHH